MLSGKQLQEIERHIKQHIGAVEHVLHEIIPLDPHIDIEIVPPTRQRNYFTLVTAGMSEQAMTVPKGENAGAYAELMLCLPPAWKFDDNAQEEERYSFPLAWLRLMARFPHDAGTYLAPGHTIPNGDPPEPLAPGSKLCCLLIRKPVTTPKEFQLLRLKKKTIQFYAVVPIYEDEMRYKIKNGFEALAGLLDRQGVTELLDVNRVWSKNSNEGLR